MAHLHQICLNHSDREAVAKCPECRHFYCRECITEHDDRLICSQCLRKKTEKVVKAPSTSLRWVRHAALGLLGFFVGWMVVYSIGGWLAEWPSDLHEGRFLENTDLEKP